MNVGKKERIREEMIQLLLSVFFSGSFIVFYKVLNKIF